MLETLDLRAGYGAAEVVRGASVRVPEGRVVAITGPNGAGKTTFARAIVGLHRARRGRVLLGERDLSAAGPVEVARTGVAIVPQGRRLFASLTVAEHLTLSRRHSRSDATTADALLELFPQLGRRLKVRARSLSGGEQQMLAIGRAVLMGPRVLVMDEPTEGLSPAVVRLVGELIAHLRERGVGVLLLEQPGRLPFEVADEVLEMDRGIVSGPTATAGEPMEPVAAGRSDAEMEQ